MIDTHCHLTDERLLTQLTDVLARAEAAGVTRMITIGTTLYMESRKWNSYIIDGETSQSWIVDGEKVAKSTLQSRANRNRRFYTAEQREKIEADRDYKSVMQPRLRNLIVVATAAQLRQYAALLGVED